MVSEWAMFSTVIAEAAVRHCGCKVTGTRLSVSPHEILENNPSQEQSSIFSTLHMV